MGTNGMRIAAAALVIVTLYAAHAYAEHQAYKTGIYIGKAAFKAAYYQDRRCRSSGSDSRRPGCEVNDLKEDSAMEGALASANIIPSLADSAPLHTGFRDGWREVRAAAFAR